jgi:uncharacterized protein with FMN-binding domain
MRKRALTLGLALAFAVAACSIAPALGGRLATQRIADGVYEGEFSSFPNSARVRVTVEGGRIAKVEVLESFGSWIATGVEKTIPERIVADQSTSVDAVTGATNSSRVIMNAAEEALEGARTGRADAGM